MLHGTWDEWTSLVTMLQYTRDGVLAGTECLLAQLSGHRHPDRPGYRRAGPSGSRSMTGAEAAPWIAA